MGPWDWVELHTVVCERLEEAARGVSVLSPSEGLIGTYLKKSMAKWSA